MTLHDDTLEVINASGNRRKIFGRNRFRIEEAAGVVKFDLGTCGAAKLCQRKIDLRGDGSGRNCFRERVLPQVAVEAAPRALTIGENDGGNGNNVPGFALFFFDEEGVRAFRGEKTAPLPDLGSHAYSARNCFRKSASRCGTRWRSCSTGSAPCWNRRFGNTGMSKPVMAFTPRETISPLSA